MALHEIKVSTRSARRGGGMTNLPTSTSKVRSESVAWTNREHSTYRKGGNLAEFQPAYTRADAVREKNKIGTYTGSGVQLSEVYSNKGLVKPTVSRVSFSSWFSFSLTCLRFACPTSHRDITHPSGFVSRRHLFTARLSLRGVMEGELTTPRCR
jgi:hypothetical protein